MRLPERSGGGRMAALREFLRGLIVQRGMGPGGVVVLAVGFAQHFCLQQRGKGFAVEELVPEPAVEALAVSVLPGAARFDKEGFEPAPLDPVLHGPGDELGAVVTADELRRASARFDGGFKDVDYVPAFHPPFHFEGHQFPAELIADGKPFVPPTVLGLVENKVVAPNVIDPPGAQPLGAAGAVPETLALALPPRHFEAFLTPEALHAFGVEFHSAAPQQCRGHAITGARMRRGDPSQIAHQRGVLSWLPPAVALRAARLLNHLTSPAL